MGEKITKEDLRREIGRVIEESRNKINNQYKEIKQSAKQKRTQADDYIKENPEKSVLAGAGLGFVLGIIISWLFSRKK